jgi:uncharacterized protein (TIGR02996 family)
MTESAFLADILEHPDDDTPRLIYADWLDDNGQPKRAQFIRVQVEAERWPEWSIRRKKLMDRSLHLLTGFGRDWDSEARQLVVKRRYRRGLIERVEMTLASWLRNWPRLYSLAPVRVVRMNAEAADIRNVGHAVYLSQFHTLDLTCNTLPQWRMRELGDLPALARLAGLNLSSLAVGTPALVPLTESPHLSGLRSLQLRDNHLSANPVPALPPASQAHLTALDLGGNYLRPAGTEALARSGWLRNLISLDLSNNALGIEGVRVLVSQPMLRLTSLQLVGNGIGTEGAEILADSPSLPQLMSLDLSSNGIDAKGAKAMAGSPHLARVAFLNLGNNRLGDAGARALLDSPFLAGCKILEVCGNRIGKKTQELLRARFGDRVVC